MASFGTEVLFVPYHGDSKSYKPSGSTSQHKHAAKEYHRKAKLKKLLDKAIDASPTSTRSPSTTSDEDAVQIQKTHGFGPLPSEQFALALSSASSFRAPSPDSMFGNIRAQPLSCGPIRNLTAHVHEMLDYVKEYQWPIFSFVNPGATFQDHLDHINYRLQVSKASFFSVLYLATTHFAFSRVGQPADSTNLMLRLNWKNCALRAMREEVQTCGDHVPEEAVYSIFALSYGSTEIVPALKSRDMSNLLAVTYDLDIFSRRPSERAHIHAMRAMVSRLGGLSHLKRSSFAQVVALEDVQYAFQNLQVPGFPLLHPTSHYMDCLEISKDDRSRMCRPLRLLLPRLPADPLVAPLQKVMTNILNISIAYERYQHNDQRATIREIIMARHNVLHDLLVCGLVRNADDWDAAAPDTVAIFELAWLSTLSYIALDLRPVCRDFGPHEMLAERLSSAIPNAIRTSLHVRQPVLFEWANELLSRLVVGSLS